MILPPLLAFLAWIPLSLVLFRRYPIRVAILMNFLAGWALLPVARFQNDPSPFWILGNGLHTGYFLTKATVTGLSDFSVCCSCDRQVSSALPAYILGPSHADVVRHCPAALRHCQS